MTGMPGLAAWPPPTARLEPERLAAGDRGRIVVTLDVPDGCHVQSNTPAEPFLIPTTVEFDEPAAEVVVGPVAYPAEELMQFDWTSVELAIYRGTIEIVVPVDIDDAATHGPLTLSGRLRYQGCTPSTCLPPVEQPIDVRVEIADT